MVITDREKAKELAIAYVNTQDLKGFRYEFVGVSENKNWPDEWGVIFDVYPPSGGVLDGPEIIVVEKKTGRVRGYEPR